MIKKAYRLKQNKDFKLIFARGKSIVGYGMVVYFLKNPFAKDAIRIGFIVSKKNGNAVERNKIKRKMREVSRKNIEVFPKGYDFVMIARPKVKGFTQNQIERELLKLLKKVGS